MTQRLTSKVLLIEADDNVVVALVDLEAGELLLESEDGRTKLKTKEPIQQSHKVAVAHIPVGGWIIKYGQRIGVASKDIRAGAHVHVHNVEDITERLVSERRPRS